jgi:aspartate racemase
LECVPTSRDALQTYFMKTLGLIGGIGPESTIEYYRLLIDGYREKCEGTSPAIIVNSVDLKRLLAWMANGELDKVAAYLAREIDRLATAGADFAALASNTPHIVFDSLRQRSRLPLVSIVEAACQKVRTLGLQTVGLFGTRYTMQASFYPEVFARENLKLVTPNAEEQAYIHDKYLGELLSNVFLDETRDRILSIAEELRQRHGIQAVILGGTELPLLLRGEAHNGIQLLDTSRIHVEALLSHMIE